MNDANDAARVRQWVSDAVMALGQGRADLAEEPVRELAARFAHKQEIQELCRWHAALTFDWPADREAVTITRRMPPAPDAVDLVMFHIDLPHAPSKVHAPIDYMAVACLAFEAAARRAPDARRVLITDQYTNVPAE